ncbi:hypothetical protein U1Q18_044667 [Sarracenia purpurea var. burkii]
MSCSSYCVDYGAVDVSSVYISWNGVYTTISFDMQVAQGPEPFGTWVKAYPPSYRHGYVFAVPSSKELGAVKIHEHPRGCSSVFCAYKIYLRVGERVQYIDVYEARTLTVRRLRSEGSDIPPVQLTALPAAPWYPHEEMPRWPFVCRDACELKFAAEGVPAGKRKI